MTTSFRIRRSRAPATAQHPFQAIPLINVLMNLLARRQRRSLPMPDPDWERDEPLSGLS